MPSVNRLAANVDIMVARRIATHEVGPDPDYPGILAEPLPIQIGLLLPETKPLWYSGGDHEWKADRATIRQSEERAWRARERALAEYYGINLEDEPEVHNRWHELALALASAHVPGFRYHTAEAAPKSSMRGAPPTLTEEQIFYLAALVARSLKRGERRFSKIVHDVMTDNKAKPIILMPARKKGSGVPPSPVTHPTARRLIKQMLVAWIAVLDGTAVAFQYRVIFVALSHDRPECRELWSLVLSTQNIEICNQ
jgi:hypothetical protein